MINKSDDAKEEDKSCRSPPSPTEMKNAGIGGHRTCVDLLSMLFPHVCESSLEYKQEVRRPDQKKLGKLSNNNLSTQKPGKRESFLFRW